MFRFYCRRGNVEKCVFLTCCVVRVVSIFQVFNITRWKINKDQKDFFGMKICYILLFIEGDGFWRFRSSFEIRNLSFLITASFSVTQQCGFR